MDRILCNGSMRGANNITLTYTNQQLEIYVYNNPVIYGSYGTTYDPTTSFQLNVTFFGKLFFIIIMLF